MIAISWSGLPPLTEYIADVPKAKWLTPKPENIQDPENLGKIKIIRVRDTNTVFVPAVEVPLFIHGTCRQLWQLPQCTDIYGKYYNKSLRRRKYTAMDRARGRIAVAVFSLMGMTKRMASL